MILETKRLTLRPWQLDDVEQLYKIAQDPLVGRPCGWKEHEDIQESSYILKHILMVPETYAIINKENGAVMGNIALMLERKNNVSENQNSAAIGCWLGRKYWKQGYATEATNEIIRHCFEDIGLDELWCASFLDNITSIKTQEKLGFTQMSTSKTVHKVSGKEVDSRKARLTKEIWLERKVKETKN